MPSSPAGLENQAMALSSEDLERIAHELYFQRRISGSIYCGNCGYNLHGLPYIYTCPECGTSYNARPLKLTGIFKPYETDPPTGDAAAAVVCALATLILVWYAIGKGDRVVFVMSLLFVALFVAFTVNFVRRLARFLKACSILRRIQRDEEDSG